MDKRKMGPVTKYEINRVVKLTNESGDRVITQVENLFRRPMFKAVYFYNILRIFNFYKVIELEEKFLKEAWREKEILKRLMSKYWGSLESLLSNLIFRQYKKCSSLKNSVQATYKISGYSDKFYFSFVFLNIDGLKTNYVYPCYYILEIEGQSQIFDWRPTEVIQIVPDYEVYLKFLLKEICFLKSKSREKQQNKKIENSKDEFNTWEAMDEHVTTDPLNSHCISCKTVDDKMT